MGKAAKQAENERTIVVGRISGKVAKDSGGACRKGAAIAVPTETIDRLVRAHPNGYLRDLHMMHKGLSPTTMASTWTSFAGEGKRTIATLVSVWVEDEQLLVSKVVGHPTENGGISVDSAVWTEVLYVGNLMTDKAARAKGARAPKAARKAKKGRKTK